jgi:hypothetical protein
MSIELSRLHIGADQSKLRAKCAQDPQTSSTISIRTRTVVRSSTVHSTRPRSRPTRMSMRICPPSRWAKAMPRKAISGMACSIQST